MTHIFSYPQKGHANTDVWSNITLFIHDTKADNNHFAFVMPSFAVRTVVCVTLGGAVDTIVEPFGYVCAYMHALK